MKRFSLLFLFAFCSVSLHAQTNTFPTTGSVGIGRTDPQAKLHIYNDSGHTQTFIEGSNQNNAMLTLAERGSSGELLWRATLGWQAANYRTLLLTHSGGDFMVPLPYEGKFGIGSMTNPEYKLDVAGNGRFTSSLRALDFRSASGDFVAGVLNGNVRVGSGNTAQGLDFYAGGAKRLWISTNGDTELDGNLVVLNNVETKQVKVSASPGTFPDYVFTSDYQLLTIDQVATFIKENGHLPNIPKAAEVEANGQDLGLIQQKLLEKIEELTLYTIEQEKKLEKVDDLKKENKSLKYQYSILGTQYSELKARNSQLEATLSALLKRVEKLESKDNK